MERRTTRCNVWKLQGLRLHNLSPDKKTAYCTVCSMNNIKRKMQDPKPPKGGKPVRD